MGEGGSAHGIHGTGPGKAGGGIPPHSALVRPYRPSCPGTPGGERLPALWPEEVDRLQQVLFYRALGVELGEIKALLDDPAFDETAALQSHLLALQGEQKRLAALIRTVEATLAAKERRTPM